MEQQADSRHSILNTRFSTKIENRPALLGLDHTRLPGYGSGLRRDEAEPRLAGALVKGFCSILDTSKITRQGHNCAKKLYRSRKLCYDLTQE